MTSLLLFRLDTGAVHYVPTDTMLEVVRANLNYCYIYTNIVTDKDMANPKFACFELREAVGGGATDTTQVQAVYDAWEKALQNKSAVIEVFLPFVLSDFTPRTLTWP